MSTPQHTTEHRDKTRTRQGAGALALSALITLAIGALILHTGHRTTTPPTASIAHPALSAAAVTTQASGLGDCLVNPYNQARACYQACTEVITLHGANQPAQTAHGATPERMRIIPNGVDYQGLSKLPQASPSDPPTVALVGRVVPIKDIRTYLQAIRILRPQIPGLVALVMGPTDEDPGYCAGCKSLATELGLSDTVQFTGQVDVTKHFPRMHVNVLTSLSESQPLSVLEAGAAGIPTVATNVGSCREILFGRSDEHPSLGDGGILTDVSSPEQTAAALGALLRDQDRRRRLGLTMQERVKRYYDLNLVDDAYARIYRHHMEAPARKVA